MYISLGPHGYEINKLNHSLLLDLGMIHPELFGQSECRSYGENIDVKKLEERLVWQVRTADGSISKADLLELGFEQGASEKYTYIFNDLSSLIIGVSDATISEAFLMKNKTKKHLNITSLFEVMNLIKIFNTDV